MNGLVKRLRDKVCVTSRDYLYEANGINYEIVFVNNKKAKCVKSVEFDASQVYFKNKKECKAVAKLINQIFKTKNKLKPKGLKVRVIFKDKDETQSEFTKLIYDLYINGKLVIKNGSVFSKVGYEKYSKKHILTTILIKIISDYAIALKFNCFKNPKDISNFEKKFKHKNLKKLLDAIDRLKTIAESLNEVKLTKEEIGNYVSLLDNFNDDYNDKMLKNQSIKKLTKDYFDIRNNPELDLLLNEKIPF